MGKQFRHSGYKRKDRDFYPTPNQYVDWLFMHWFPDSSVVDEPFAGECHMVRALESFGLIVTADDLLWGTDFIMVTTERDCTISNPPYDRTLCPKLVRHAINLSQQTAMLLPATWDCAGGRVDMFTVKSPFRLKVVCNKRIPWEKGTRNGGMHDYAWFVWDKAWCNRESIVRFAPLTE